VKTSNATLEWLLEGEPWIVYRTRLDLMGQSETDPEVISARNLLLENSAIRGLLKELAEWPGNVVSSHKSAGQPFHKLTFIADLGFKTDDPGMNMIIDRILAHRSTEGPFQLPMNIPTHYGGSGYDEWAWALCDAPLIVYALVKFGLSDRPEVRAAITYLVDLVRDNGWPCAVSKELGKFRGPGRKDDPCPFANLATLKLLSEIEEYRDHPACHAGVETLLTLWKESSTKHPYMFYMGTDFRKLKVPFVWYDLLHVLEILSRFTWIREDERFLDMYRILKGKADGQGLYSLESIWTAWKDWEFGQKKEPSRWLTLLAWRIIGRVE
jgi:hypothetical protein